MEKIHIGTSGWNFKSWLGNFYPEKTRAEDLLPTYAKTFETVELNNSFYNLPKAETVQIWRERTPDGFLFSCKASRYLTHMKKLNDPAEPFERLMSALKPFGDKLGPILFQLPPKWKVNTERLGHFLQMLSGEHRYTFEFRDQSWLCGEVFEILEKYGAALCFYDLRGFSSPEVPTADFIYIRLHGPETDAYQGSYDDRTIAAYTKKIREWAKDGKEVFCYFDNDKKSQAPFDAKKLMQKLKGSS